MKAAQVICFHLLIVGSAFLFPACAPTTQLRVDLIRGDMRLGKDWRGELSAALHTSTLDAQQQGEIDTRESFARDGQGRRYSLMAEKIPFVESCPEKSYFLQRRLWCLSVPGQRLAGWPDGHWRLHVVRRHPGGSETYDVTFKLFTRFWTPLSGAPN